MEAFLERLGHQHEIDLVQLAAVFVGPAILRGARELELQHVEEVADAQERLERRRAGIVVEITSHDHEVRREVVGSEDLRNALRLSDMVAPCLRVGGVFGRRPDWSDPTTLNRQVSNP